MNKLFVLGNGFDRSHGLKTSYYDFKEFLISNKGQSFVAAMEKYIDSDELWSTFEDALGTLDDDELKENSRGLLVGYGDDNWHDSYHHDYQYSIGQELMFAKEIRQWLYSWIESIDLNNTIPKFYLLPEDYYLSFNYTSVLETIYQIPIEKVLHIHGCVQSGVPLTVGHGKDPEHKGKRINSMEDFENECIESDDFRIIEANDIIDEYYKSTYKDTKK